MHGLEVDHNVLSNLNLPSMVKFSDPNNLKSSKSARALTLLHNVIEDEYRNGIYFELRDDGASVSLKTSIYDNIALAIQSASEFQGLKR